MKRQTIDDIFNTSCPTAYKFFLCGTQGHPLNKLQDYLNTHNMTMTLTQKQAYTDGLFKFKLPTALSITTHLHYSTTHFHDFYWMPQTWTGTTRRFFACSKNNTPLTRWGYVAPDPITNTSFFDPNLLPLTDATCLSPVRWVGQNTYLQPFVVLDVDGVGHGCVDTDTIRFGEQFKNKTLTYEDPTKPGSFHLYFKTNRLIPTQHFPHAKLDLIGNNTNAAVYFKNKVSNHKPMLDLNAYIYNEIQKYQQSRKDI